MLDRIAAVAALAGLAAFLGVLVYRVPEGPLMIVLGGVFILAAVDAGLATRRRGGKGSDDG